MTSRVCWAHPAAAVLMLLAAFSGCAYGTSTSGVARSPSDEVGGPRDSREPQPYRSEQADSPPVLDRQVPPPPVGLPLAPLDELDEQRELETIPNPTTSGQFGQRPVPIVTPGGNLPPTSPPPNTSPGVAALVRSNNQFALDLYGQLISQDQGNLFFSPLSISTAFSMVYGGARGRTADEMAAALRLSLPQEQLHSTVQELCGSLGQASKSSGYQVRLANRLWGQQDYRWMPAFLRLTRDHYGAELASVDFRQPGDSAREQINRWVEQQTAGKIQNILSPNDLTSNTRMVLTNAIYFQGAWSTPFDRQATQAAPFSITPNQTVQIPQMQQQRHFRYGEPDGLQILELPYGRDRNLSMLVLLPRPGRPLAELESKLTGANLEAWGSGLGSRLVQVVLPRFRMTSRFRLNDVLRRLGMVSVFDKSSADLGGITSVERLYIYAAIHKAFVEVNEAGTEAAAATAVTAVPCSNDLPRPVEFRADRPFVFLIRDDRSGSILFIGRVTNPSA